LLKKVPLNWAVIDFKPMRTWLWQDCCTSFLSKARTLNFFLLLNQPDRDRLVLFFAVTDGDPVKSRFTPFHGTL
jgi:hypothetical protein